MDNRNPYLLLGVDYGTDPERARRSFARAARRVRRSGGDAISIEDLNWALHEMQQHARDAADSVAVFRVPANPAVLRPGGHGAFAPAPRPLARRTTPDQADADRVTEGLTEDLWALLGATAPVLTRFDTGYEPVAGGDSA